MTGPSVAAEQRNAILFVGAGMGVSTDTVAVAIDQDALPRLAAADGAPVDGAIVPTAAAEDGN